MPRMSMYEKKVKPKLDIIQGWARNGLTLDDIAHNLGISKGSLRNYKTKHKELNDAIEEGKEIADIRVENALYRRAVGFYSTEQKVVMIKDDDGTSHPEIVEYEVYNKPDVTAQIFWLKNRKPDVWRDKVVVDKISDECMDMLMIGARDEEDSMETTAEAVSLSEPQ